MTAVIRIFFFLVFAAHLLSVAHYPAGWYDEIEILEMGRFSIFEVLPDWSVNLIMNADGSVVSPLPYFHYLSGWLQEALYRLTGTFIAARVFFLCSLPVCAYALFAWLRGHGIDRTAACLAALCFLLDPNATICAHWYRPDLWCLTMALGAALLVRRRQYLLAGGLSAVMLSFWITSMLFLPLIVWEAWTVSTRRWRDAAVGAIGFVLMGVVLLLPLYPNWGAIVAQYQRHSELGGGVVGFQLQNLVDMVKIAARSPFVWGAALIGGVVAWRKAPMHALILVGLIVMMLMTRVYHLRMIYLLPYLFLLVALAIERFSTKLPRMVVGVALVAYFMVSVVGIEYAAWPSGANRLQDLQARLQREVGGANQRVYLHDAEHELYYAGRALGWKMFSTVPRGNILTTEKGRELVASLDAYLVSNMATEPLTDEQGEILRTLGFRKTAHFDLDRGTPNAIKSRLEQLFYAHGYLGCDVWRREKYDQK